MDPIKTQSYTEVAQATCARFSISRAVITISPPIFSENGHGSCSRIFHVELGFHGEIA